MASFVATYTSATGQPRSLTLKASDLVEAKKMLRRRGIKATELKAAVNNNEKKDGKEEQQSLLSFDLGKVFEKPPGVKDCHLYTSDAADE